MVVYISFKNILVCIKVIKEELLQLHQKNKQINIKRTRTTDKRKFRTLNIEKLLSFTIMCLTHIYNVPRGKASCLVHYPV